MEPTTQAQFDRTNILMKEFVDTVFSFYNNIKEQDVCQMADEQTLEKIRKQSIPQQGRPVEEVYREMLSDIYPNMSRVQHPRCFACIPSPVSLFSWMGDVMTNAFDPHAGSWLNSSGASCVEQELIRWMCSLAGYPQSSGGLFVSGGSMANLTALTAARDSKLTDSERPLAVAYVSDQTHSSIAKGLHIIGFRADQVRKVPSDSNFRMRLDQLTEAIREDLAAGRMPFAVIATAGTTNTGSIDPLDQIAQICQEYNLWMHVDGAFGASLLLSPRYRGQLKGIERSDSMSWDAHKWLMQTYGCSMVLLRDRSKLLQSFSTHPEYLRDAETSDDNPNFWDLGPELTRPARGLKLWITLQVMGSEGLGRVIEHGCKMAQLAEKTIMEYPHWEMISHAQQGIINFRYAPPHATEQELDLLNLQIAKEINDTGYAQILTTELNGKRVLRMCILNPQTTEEDIVRTISLLNQTRAVTQRQPSKKVS